jgi:hypothetical protein
MWFFFLSQLDSDWYVCPEIKGIKNPALEY